MKFKTILIVGGALAVAGVFALWYLKRQHTTPGSGLSELAMINYLQTNQYSDVPTDKMLTYDAGYVTAWYNGALNSQSVFVYNGKNYDVNGGGAM